MLENKPMDDNMTVKEERPLTDAGSDWLRGFSFMGS